MIIDLERGLCVIHIPRTGGISLAAAIADACPGATVDLGVRRHAVGWRLREIVKEMGGDWGAMLRVAVVRNPWEVCASDYRLTARDAERGVPDTAAAGWRARLDRYRADPRFGRFVEEEWLGPYSGIRPGGLWRTWCEDQDGNSLGVLPIPMRCLDRCWPCLCVRLGLPVTQLSRLNGAEGEEAAWTGRLLQAVGDLCHRDCELFGYGQ